MHVSHSSLPTPASSDPLSPGFLQGGGEMGELMRRHDWSASSLGAPEAWPQSLRTVVRLMLNTGHPMYIWWGADSACLYNDAYRESIGPERHPGSLGRPAREVWDEIWDIIDPQMEKVRSGRGATWNVNHLVPITRHGRREDVYWTYSYSPIDDEASPGGIGGVLVLCTETTEQVLANQRMAAERDQLGQLEAKYRELAETLAEANRTKDEFLATLAHELRNPLAPIRNALALQRHASDNPKILASSRDIIERQVTQMVRLIDDLLDLSRLSRGIVELRRTPLSLIETVGQAVETSRPAIEQSGRELIARLPGLDCVVDADETRILQVLTNLMNNAAKFTAVGGTIEVSLSREGSSALLSVKDDGIGIPPNMLKRVFNMFTQVERSHAHVGGGLGIGLTIVRQLVEQHGGAVEAHSAGAGLGSEFVVSLPLSASALASADRADAPPAQFAASGLRVLVADDNMDVVDSLSMLLEISGHDVKTARNGAEAFEVAQAFQPQAMLIDIAMPLIDGHELCRRIRATPWGRDALMIAASGWGQATDRHLSEQAGFDHHLVKPVDFDAVDALLAVRSKGSLPDLQ
jgi:signal transduction histidine kinase/CheY-like chemotaxis protein